MEKAANNPYEDQRSNEEFQQAKTPARNGSDVKHANVAWTNNANEPVVFKRISTAPAP